MKRVLLKLSGEALAGDKKTGFDEATCMGVAKQVKQAPSGMVYGVVENTKHHIIVATPFGKYTIEKKDGGVSFMGMSAKLVSSKNGVYKVKTSLGNFTVNARKGTVIKN